MPYPSRPVLEALPEFQGTATVRQSAEQRERLVAFSAEQYRAGVRGHGKVPAGGHVRSPLGGQVKVPTLCSCRP